MPVTVTKPITFRDGYMQLNPDLIADQRLFQNTFGHGDLPYPQIPSADVRERRLKLVSEEYTEFESAHEVIEQLSALDPDDPVLLELAPAALAQLADAIADSIYVLIGTAFEYGLPIAEIWREVQRSNMSKLWTVQEVMDSLHDPEKAHWTSCPAPGVAGIRCRLVYNEYGKVQKPPGFRPPDIEAIVKKAYHDKANPSETPPDQAARRKLWQEALAANEDQAYAGPPPSRPPYNPEE
jgi:predicted HAD superfamily Cof-like phosphohydrolase